MILLIDTRVINSQLFAAVHWPRITTNFALFRSLSLFVFVRSNFREKRATKGAPDLGAQDR